MGISQADLPVSDRLRLLELVAERSPDLHTVTGPDGLYRYVSAAGLAGFGWEPSDLIGRSPADCTHPDDAALLNAAYREVGDSSAGEPPVSTLARFRCLGDTFRWTESLST